MYGVVFREGGRASGQVVGGAGEKGTTVVQPSTEGTHSPTQSDVTAYTWQYNHRTSYIWM